MCCRNVRVLAVADFAYKFVWEIVSETATHIIPTRQPQICRSVSKLKELYVLCHLRANIAKLVCCGSQRIQLKSSPRKYLYIQILARWYLGSKCPTRGCVPLGGETR